MSCALADFSDWDSLPTDPAPDAVEGSAVEVRAIEIRAVFRGVVTHARILSPSGTQRRKTRRHFTIGSEAGVDAPVAANFVPWASHPLVMSAGNGYVINVTPQMKGKVRVGGQVQTLATFTRDNGNTFALPSSGSAQVDCGATSFIVTSTSPPRPLPVPFWNWKWNQQRYTVGSAVVLAVMLLMLSFVPADPRSLSLDILGSDNHFVRFLITPPVADETQLPPWLAGKQTVRTAGSTGQRAQSHEGAMGDASSPRRPAKFAIKGHANPDDVRLSKTLAVGAIQNAGVLGILRAQTGSHVSSIFGAETALGSDAENVLGNLVGIDIAAAYGRNGLGVTGTGAGAAGTGDDILGVGELKTIGRRGGAPNGGRYAPGVGALHTRQATPPHWIPGDVVVRGTLDKEIVRRIIRLHLNEIKYCYEQELSKTPSLGGRILVQFAISSTGKVISSALQSSTMGNSKVENCTVQAVRRWPFPQPSNGGLVMVSYPFVLAPAGG